MIKTGLARLEDLSTRSALKGLFGGRRQPSIALYEDALGLPDGNWWAEEILKNFSDARGVYKRTQSNRFADFDRDVIDLIHGRFAGQAIRLHDVGSSDARTSYDFMKAIVDIMPNITMIASDRCNSIFVYQSDEITVTVEPSGSLLEIAKPPFVFSMISHENFGLYPINFLIRELIARPAAKKLLRAARGGHLKARRIPLVCKSALELARTDGRFQITEYDLLAPPRRDGYFHVVRAMNILNPCYFSEPQLHTITATVLRSLTEGGLFVVGSNQDAGSPVAGAVYSRHHHGFQRASNFRWAPPAIEATILGPAN